MAVYRWFELCSLFLLLPLALLLFVAERDTWLLPMLLSLGAVCLYLLLKDTNFKRFRLWHVEGFSHHLRASLRLFIPSALVISLLVYVLTPDAFFLLPSQHLDLWLATMLIYPLLSVIPQELIFRTFFFHRYKQILPSKHWRLAISSCSFALAHVIYGNWVAVAVSCIGGLIFGYRYMQSRSTLVVIAEHSLWGCFLFTIGVGVFLMTSPGA